jgi:hypothetical protein
MSSCSFTQFAGGAKMSIHRVHSWHKHVRLFIHTVRWWCKDVHSQSSLVA